MESDSDGGHIELGNEPEDKLKRNCGANVDLENQPYVKRTEEGKMTY